MGKNEGNRSNSGKLQIIRPPSILSEEAFGEPTIWLKYSFGREWFQDALREATVGRDHNARRRELIFAVCFAEAYLVEWVRDDILKGALNKLSEYFPPGAKRSAEDKWKEVPSALLGAGLIPASPNWGEGEAQQAWEEWLKLVRYRNGLIHARSSRPETDPQPNAEAPYPSKSDLDKLPGGWPTKVVVNLVQLLHKAAGTPAPIWLVEP